MPELPTSGVPFDRARLTRRGFMVAGIAGGLTLAACSQSRSQATGSAAQMTAAIAAAEAARPHSGRTVTASLTPQLAQIDLGGPIVHTLAYRQHHSRAVDPGQHRRRACRHGFKPARPSHIGALARHRTAQRYGRRCARHPEHRCGPRLHLPVFRPEFRHLLGPSAHRTGHRHGSLPAGYRRRSNRGQLRR